MKAAIERFTPRSVSPAVARFAKEVTAAAAPATPNRAKVGTLPRAKVREIAELKLKDLNANDLEGAIHMVEGTARSMGVDVE